MHAGGWAQHICVEPMARVSVELLPGAEWRGRQRITIPPPAIADHDIHPMLHAPTPTPPSLLSEVKAVVVDTMSVGVDWRGYIAAELERIFGPRLESGHQAALRLPLIPGAEGAAAAAAAAAAAGGGALPSPPAGPAAADVTTEDGSVDWESLASQWRKDNLADSTVFADGDGLANGVVARRRGLDRIVEYLKPAMTLGQAPEEQELDRLARAWLRLPTWEDVPAGLSAIRGTYMVAGIDAATSLWDLTALSKHSQMAAAARMSPEHSPPRTPSRGSTPPAGGSVGSGSRPPTPGSPVMGERLRSPFASQRRPGSRAKMRPGSREGGIRPSSRPSSRDGGFNFSLGGGGFSSMVAEGGGLQWDVTLPPLGSPEDLATYDRAATLLGKLPSAMLFVSSSPHALLIAQRAGWRTAYVPRLGAVKHPRLLPNYNTAPHTHKSADNIPAGPRSVGHSHAEASLQKERVFGSTHDAEARLGNVVIDEAPTAATTGSWIDAVDEEEWDGALFDVSAPDLTALAGQLVPPHTRRWRS